jgi:probable F420-dependent oxidoreductase
MASERRFRFGVQARTTGSKSEWVKLVRSCEDLGYSTLSVYDHFVRGYDPMAALGAAAIASTSLRLGTLVIDTDFRHPAILAKGLATLDLLSDGRLEIGVGAGWLREEYEQTGIPFDAPGVRIERMIETIAFLKQSFVEERTTFDGRFVSTHELVLPPKPVQRPHPPFLIGGGGRRVLTAAAKHADIVGLTARTLMDGSKAPRDMTAGAVAEKVGWIREAAGARFDEIELTSFINPFVLTGDQDSAAAELGSALGMSVDEVLASPNAFVGTLDQMEYMLETRRETYGISYFIIEEQQVEAFAPLVERLTGR